MILSFAHYQASVLNYHLPVKLFFFNYYFLKNRNQIIVLVAQ